MREGDPNRTESSAAAAAFRQHPQGRGFHGDAVGDTQLVSVPPATCLQPQESRYSSPSPLAALAGRWLKLMAQAPRSNARILCEW